MAHTVFLDTSFVVALENRDDTHHERARQLDAQLLNEEAVLGRATHPDVLKERSASRTRWTSTLSGHIVGALI